jgi:hypothetical protein
MRVTRLASEHAPAFPAIPIGASNRELKMNAMTMAAGAAVLAVLAVGIGTKLGQESQPAAVAAPVRQTPIHVSYDEVARYPAHYLGKAVVFSGKVVQVINDTSDGAGLFMRVAVTKDKHGWWEIEDVVLLRYANPLKSDGRVLENDIIEFRGVFKGMRTYKAVLGQNIEKPLVTACDVRVISNPSPRAARDCT